jgi:hypothetical protein
MEHPMCPKRNRNRTIQPQHSQLIMLLDAAALRLVAVGTVRVDPAPYLAAARVLLTTAQGCGLEAATTDLGLLERHLGQRGWACRWEGADSYL